ncbi:MAG TPA: DUF4147 domain-containing protein [Thiotrichales bacterium]|nr:DUF4147 domain-containing protein [Thiotrichales bacterium]
MAPCREILLDLYHAALRRVEGEFAVSRWLAGHPLDGDWHLVAFGKAAPAMTRGALKVLGARLREGLVITRRGTLDPALCADPRIRCLEAGHPLPDRGSLVAGDALLRFLEGAPEDARFLFLISGGGSALVEALPPGRTLEDLQRLNEWLLASGLDIHAMNAIRKRLSLIKGGRLLAPLRGREAVALLISDVRGDDPAVIASGPLVAVAQPLPADVEFPAWLGAWLEEAPPPVAEGRVELHVVARSADALEAAEARAHERGMAVSRHAEFVAGDAATAGERLAVTVVESPGRVHLWGGETTVVLPPGPGKGGRCQQLALAAALRLAGRHGCCLLAAGSDGRDGPGRWAGACVDGDTVARGVAAGMVPEEALAHADAGTFLQASGDLIETGPTGTNVMDLMFGLCGGEA